MNFQCFKQLIFIYALINLASCASNQSVNIKTLPDKSNVKLINTNGEVTELGESPLSISHNELFKGNHLIKLQISKDNFNDETLVLTKPHSTQSISLSVKLDRKISNENTSDKKIDKFAFSIAEVQSKIHKKDFSGAKSILSKIISEYDHLSVPHDLMGNIYFLQGRKSSALREYRLANSIDPNNFKRISLIRKIESDLNVRN